MVEGKQNKTSLEMTMSTKTLRDTKYMESLSLTTMVLETRELKSICQNPCNQRHRSWLQVATLTTTMFLHQRNQTTCDTVANKILMKLIEHSLTTLPIVRWQAVDWERQCLSSHWGLSFRLKFPVGFNWEDLFNFLYGSQSRGMQRRWYPKPTSSTDLLEVYYK